MLQRIDAGCELLRRPLEAFERAMIPKKISTGMKKLVGVSSWLSCEFELQQFYRCAIRLRRQCYQVTPLRCLFPESRLLDGETGLSKEKDGKLSSLTVVKEPGGEKNDRDHKGHPGMKDVMQVQAEERVCKPCGKAHKPYPCCLLEHPHASMLRGEVERAQFAGLVLH